MDSKGTQHPVVKNPCIEIDAVFDVTPNEDGQIVYPMTFLRRLTNDIASMDIYDEFTGLFNTKIFRGRSAVYCLRLPVDPTLPVAYHLFDGQIVRFGSLTTYFNNGAEVELGDVYQVLI